MSCTRSELVKLADSILQPLTFKDYCPNGLQVQGRDIIKKLVAGVSACQELLDAAVAAQADAVLVHHGYFWRGEAAALTGAKHQRIASLIKNDINLLAYHLPLDAHPTFGNNVQLAQQLGLEFSATADSVEQGLLATGRVPHAVSGVEFAELIEQRLLRRPLHIAANGRRIERIAWCTGGAQHFIEQAIELGVDAYLSGEISEQTTHAAREAGIHYFAAGHHATERYGVQALGRHLSEQLDIEFEFIEIDNPA